MPDVIGFISGVLGIYSFVATLVPPQPESPFATVRVGVGLSGTPGEDGPLDDPQGTIKSIRIYNNNQAFLSASSDNIFIEDGGYTDAVLDQVTTQQAPFVQIRNGDGEKTCIASVSVTFADGQQRGWDGTWAQRFGITWYYSGVLVTEASQNTGECLWLDADVGTIFIFMPRFSPVEGEKPDEDVRTYVGTRGFRAYNFNDATGEIALPRSLDTKKRAAAAKEPDSRLVVSDRPGHSAVKLCDSDTSWGPSFVSLAEGMFCNMETRELLPLCVGELTEGCFDVENAKAASGQRARSVEGTGYSHVIEWTTDNS
ncbi:hypothetical protein QBC37DRAFT_380961 [Rhypophila decipiens]|uniref:Uncharacterized protein n=1 Tax=Rhypophila decipiens TaxID=261697 RepID=A0AAN6XVZ0_9PEZI|nr:hypothetical protein QBC37DRAFT_380961 [Rhypophila decipiens]